MMKKVLFTLAFLATCFTASAQENKNDSLPQRTFWDRLSIGGYGELAFSRNFYSDHVSRYSQPEAHKNDPSHGRFDIPHFTIALGYDFGKGWTLGTEIEFEHGGNGIAYEKEDEEGGEWEQETEKGGEVEPGAVLDSEVLRQMGKHPCRTHRRTCRSEQCPSRAPQFLHGLPPGG